MTPATHTNPSGLAGAFVWAGGRWTIWPSLLMYGVTGCRGVYERLSPQCCGHYQRQGRLPGPGLAPSLLPPVIGRECALTLPSPGCRGEIVSDG